MALPFPPTTSEQRASLYADVETLLTVGFLSHPVTVGGVRMALRTLGPGDLVLLQARISDQATVQDWQAWTIASSVWLLNGTMLLGEANAAVKIMPTLRTLPKEASATLFSVLSGLLNRQTKALQLVESFSYESSSRFLWKAFGGKPVPDQVGLQNAHVLGTNNIQRVWTFYNLLEDQRHLEEAQWEGFKLVTSAQSPKGIKKLDQQDKQRHKLEQERRQQVQDYQYYLAKGLIKPDDKALDGTPLARMGASKSVEQLEDEMYRWVTGQEDEHDTIVREYKQRITQRFEQEKKEREERLVLLTQAREVTELQQGQQALVGYTPEQLQGLLRGRGLGQPGVSSVLESKGSREYLYNKYLETEPLPARKAAGSRLVPIEEDTADLEAVLTARKVLFHTEEGDHGESE